MSYASLKVPYCCVCDTYINGEVVVVERGEQKFLFHQQCLTDSEQKIKEDSWTHD